MAFIKKLGELRPNQLVTVNGPGSIADVINDSVTVVDIDYWDASNQGEEIRDSRIASYLRVKHLYMPHTGGQKDIPVVSFPYYHVCSKWDCNYLFDIRENGIFNLSDYAKNQGQLKCPKCGYRAFPSRFITICEDGHMDDFPWRWWVHRGDTSCKGDLILKSTGNSSSLSELVVSCKGCGAHRNMTGAMQKESLEGLICTGHHPQRPRKKNDDCKKIRIPSQRGASNVYFPVIRSAISIPPWTDPVYELIQSHLPEIELVEGLGDMGLKLAYDKYFSTKCSFEEFKQALAHVRQKVKEYVELKEKEYDAIIHHTDVAFQKNAKHFKAEEEPVPAHLQEYIARMIKLQRLREVRVLHGYMRLEAPDPEMEEDKHEVKLQSKGEWLPAVNIHGEGIYIELNHDKVDAWLANAKVKQRSDAYLKYYHKYCVDRGWQVFKPRDGKYVLLHTLSHMLMKQMAIESGYSSTALHERIYCSDKMCGLLIYTGAPDQEGTLGGLVEQGTMKKFIPLLKHALEEGLYCTTDPECFLRDPEPEKVNGCACHSCTMISETACETGNRLLDRALVVPLPEKEEVGYFRDLVNALCGAQI